MRQTISRHCIIDVDLQYPPESICDLLWQMTYAAVTNPHHMTINLAGVLPLAGTLASAHTAIALIQRRRS